MIELHLEGDVVPKARPRVTENGTYLPENYDLWKQSAIVDFTLQYHGEALRDIAWISIVLSGKHSRRGDADNIAGSILDALVQSKAIAGDNLTIVPGLSIELIHSNKKPTVQIFIIQKNEFYSKHTDLTDHLSCCSPSYWDSTDTNINELEDK
jgi:Holliday junction resolvase RusA-like endonuclease